VLPWSLFPIDILSEALTLLTRTLVAMLFAVAVSAQAPRVNPERAPETPGQVLAANAARYDYRPDVAILAQMVRALQPAAQLTGEGKAQVDRLTKEAAALQREGNTGDARRRLSQAIVLQLGRAWNAKEEYAASLVLRSDATVADSSRPYVAQLAQRFPMHYQAAGAVRLRVSLAEGGAPGRADVVVAAGRVIRELATFDLPARDLIDDPFRFGADLSSVPEGAYLIVAEVLDSGNAAARLVTPVYLVHNFEARRQAIETRLKKIQGHSSTKATIAYPWDLARGLNTASREVNAFDFGAAVKRSEELVAALEAGKDPLYRAVGDTKRNYYFAEAGEIMPYRVYVPVTWTPSKSLPMIVALHGSQLDENNFLTRADARLCKLAEQYGYIVAAPLGYRINGGYGRGLAGALPGGSTLGGGRTGELSEKDAMNVLEIVATEYNADRTRIFLMGNSMGGSGTWQLGAKYAERFAALAPCAFGIGTSYPYDRLTGMPILAVVGDQDRPFLQPMRDSIEKLKEHGIDARLTEVKGGTHSTAVEEMLPAIVEFFNAHRRADASH
jgi:poly(3-hydroxybutyrate) depolymerase